MTRPHVGCTGNLTGRRHWRDPILISRRLTGRCLILVGLAATAPFTRAAPFDRKAYPAARRSDVVDVVHGVRVPDPYRWLEDEESEETQTWVKQQNTLRRKCLEPLAATCKQIARELEALYSPDAMSSLAPRRERYFLSRHEGLQNHSVIYVREGGYKAESKVVIDPNTFSPDGTVALDWWYPSPDGSLIAYGKSSSGSEKSTLYIRDVRTGKDLPDAIPFTQYCNVAWDPDGKGFYYNRCPDPATVPAGEENFYMKVYHHTVGTDVQQDRYVWGKGRPKDEEPAPYTSCDHKYLLMGFYRDPARNDLFFARLDGRDHLRPIAQGLDANVSADILDDRIFIRTNFKAPRYRICTTTVDKPGPEHWTDLIPQRTKGVIHGFLIVDRKLVVRVSEDVHSRVLVYDFEGGQIDEVKLPAIGTASGLRGQYDKPELFFSFTSWVVPPSVYRYDLRTRKLETLFQQRCPVDLSPYVSRQLWYTSKDGTRVPMFVVHKKNIRLDGTHPTLLYGYGGFNIGLYPRFRPRIIPFLQRGGVWALANIRGGGEFGRDWHRGGRRETKQRCFDDFIAAAEKLIELKYTNPRKLACKGGSNGGLLIGAAITQRPDLFQAALCQVPLLDMLRFHKFGMGAQWVHEYGNPDHPDEFRWVHAYSPYHHVRDGTDYPATLFVTAESDNRVDTAHTFKMTARMQAATSGNRPILTRVETKAGHGAGKPLTMRIEHRSEDWTFLMWQLGMINSELGSKS